MEPSPKKVREEEKASGISVEELMEKESLIEELVEREDAIQAKAESALKQQLKDNETVGDIQKKAMESLWREMERPRNAIQKKVELNTALLTDVQKPLDN